MLNTFRKECRVIWQSEPGDRFQARYRRVRRGAGRDEVAPRVLRIVFAVVCLLIGLVFLFLPFPEIPFFIACGALLAAESSPLARTLDRIELRMRAWGGRIKAPRRILPVVGKGLMGALFFSAVAGEVYFFCRFCCD